MRAPLPKNLYKYQSCNEYTFNNLRRKHFWFSKPEKFNDPFDCNINFQIGDKTEENFELLFNWARKNAPDKNDFDEKYHSAGKVNQTFKDKILEVSRTATVGLIKNYSNFGVTCFSEIHDDILMWSHYSSSHQGFCMEFDTTKFPFTRTNSPDKDTAMEKVDYSDSYPTISIKDIVSNQLPSLPQSLLTVKSPNWCYEREWRLFSKSGNTELAFDNAALSGVYLGCIITEENKEIIKSILGNSIPIYEMQRSTTEFKVIAKEIR
jgi:hypothetical protein